MWRAGAGVLAITASLTVVEAAVAPKGRLATVLIGAVISGILGLIAWWVGPRLSPRMSYTCGRIFLVASTLTVATSAYAWRGTAAMGVVAFHFILVMLFTAAFFGRYEVAEVVVLIGLVSAYVFHSTGRFDLNLFMWLTLMTDLVCAGVVMSIVVERMRTLSYNDPLTGSFNRRWWEVALQGEIEEFVRTGAPLSLALIDIDHFKAVNDTLGHQGGDEFLQRAVTIFQTRIRSADQFARIGGDEFAVILPGCTERVATDIANSLLAALVIETGASCSIGVATIRRGDEPTMLYTVADQQLYAAKLAGRAQVRSTRTIDTPQTTIVEQALSSAHANHDADTRHAKHDAHDARSVLRVEIDKF